MHTCQVIAKLPTSPESVKGQGETCSWKIFFKARMTCRLESPPFLLLTLALRFMRQIAAVSSFVVLSVQASFLHPWITSVIRTLQVWKVSITAMHVDLHIYYRRATSWGTVENQASDQQRHSLCTFIPQSESSCKAKRGLLDPRHFRRSSDLFSRSSWPNPRSRKKRNSTHLFLAY